MLLSVNHQDNLVRRGLTCVFPVFRVGLVLSRIFLWLLTVTDISVLLKVPLDPFLLKFNIEFTPFASTTLRNIRKNLPSVIARLLSSKRINKYERDESDGKHTANEYLLEQSY